MSHSRLLLVVASILFSATAALSQGITIDDDGWSRSESSGTNDFMVDIGDDGYARMDKPVRDMDQPFQGSGCTQLEMQMGMSGGGCGQTSKADVASSYIGAHD